MAYAVSDSFRAALATSHVSVVRAQVCDVDGVVLATLQPLGGNVTVDLERSIRREAGDLSLVDPTGTLVVDDATDLLSPLSGYEIRLYRGIEYASGTQELMPLGVFGWSKATVAEGSDGLTITVNGLQDRAAKIGRSRLASPYAIASATAVETVVEQLLTRAYPDVDLGAGLPETGRTVPASAWAVEGDSDPWEDAYAVAADYGYRLSVNVDGEVVMDSIADVNTADPIVEYGDSGLDVLLGISREWDIADTYNGVVAIGVGSGLAIPARAIAWDDDPNSPTYYQGSFGRRPRVYSSGRLVTKADAQRAADAQLARTLGISESVAFTALVDPSLDVGDRVRLRRSTLGINGTYRIDRLDIPLGPDGAMGVEARTRRVSA